MYGWSFCAVIQTGTIAAVGVAFSNFSAYLYEPLGEQNILFSIASFQINAAQVLAIVMIVILTNIMYLAVVPFDAIATAKYDRVAVVVADSIFGNIRTLIIAIIFMISTFACNNGLIMARARVYYTMAQDGLFFKKAADLNRSNVPAWALWLQCVLASALCLTATYGALLDFVIIIVYIFYILTIYGIFILRKKSPNLERPYTAFGYAFIPMIYIVFSTALCIALLLTEFSTCGWGVLIMLSGIPIYYLTKSKV